MFPLDRLLHIGYIICMKINVGDIIRPKHERTIFGVVTKGIDQNGNLRIIWFNSPRLTEMMYPEHSVVKVS